MRLLRIDCYEFTTHGELLDKLSRFAGLPLIPTSEHPGNHAPMLASSLTPNLFYSFGHSLWVATSLTEGDGFGMTCIGRFLRQFARLRQSLTESTKKPHPWCCKDAVRMFRLSPKDTSSTNAPTALGAAQIYAYFFGNFKIFLKSFEQFSIMFRKCSTIKIKLTF